MKLIIASDHAGFELKEFLKSNLAHPAFSAGSHEIPHQVRNVIEWIDLGTNSKDSVDYPDFGKKAADALANGQAEFGIVVCGSGIGISIAANRNPKVRCALLRNAEEAKLARQHNNANMVALGERLTTPEQALEIVKTFLTTPFEGGRHAARVEKLS